MTAKVTLFSPIYNDGRYVDDLVASVISQTYKDFEFIIFDNGSTDRTRQIIVRHGDPRIRLITSQKNLRSETAIAILDRIESEYIAQIYADDMFMPDKLERSIEKLEKTNADVVFSNNSFMSEHGAPIPPEHVPHSQFRGDISLMDRYEHLYHMFYYGNSLHPVSMVIRRDAYREVGGLNGNMHQIGDMEFFVRLLLFKDVAFIREPLQRIRIRDARPEQGGNESALNDRVVSKIRAERVNFLKLFRTPEALAIVDKIFLPRDRGIVLPDSLRLWFMGHMYLSSTEPDFRLFGIECIYDALRENGAQIDPLITGATGLTPGAYVDTLTPKVFPSEADRTMAVGDIFGRLDALKAELKTDIEVSKSFVSPETLAVIDNYRTQAEAMRASTSWRLTAPLRRMASLFKRTPQPA